jgi:hypothetical protein
LTFSRFDLLDETVLGIVDSGEAMVLPVTPPNSAKHVERIAPGRFES